MAVSLLSAVIPCYKKERVVYAALSDVRSELSKLGVPFEMVLVDDGSPDGTLSELKRFCKSKKNCRVVALPRNHGKGNALLDGFRHSRGDVVLLIDADKDLPPRQIPLFLQYLERYNADVVIGSKNHPDSIVKYPLMRRFLSRIYQIICFVLFQMPVSDTQVGLKLFKRPVLEYAAPKMLVKRYAFDPELLVLAHYGGFYIREAPIELHFRGSSGVAPQGIFNMLWDTMAIWYRLKIMHYYDKIDPG
jgi:glycosyltransferase involved in cell wall biosynthesis